MTYGSWWTNLKMSAKFFQFKYTILKIYYAMTDSKKEERALALGMHPDELSVDNCN